MSDSGDGEKPKLSPIGDPPSNLHLWKLPRGRHGLPRELVVQSQRERLLAAVVRVTAAKGYQASSVADILKEAGVGRETFYKHFKDKEDCFVTANDALVADLETKVKEAYEQPGPWPQRVRRGLESTLEWFAASPEIARVMMIEMGTVGPIASSRFRETFRRFTGLLDEGREFAEDAPNLPNLANIAGGAVFARIYEEVALGNATNLPHLMPQLTFELLLPYIGEEAADRERDAAAAEQDAAP
ncbi:MAG TPA: TetR/AcrR family transcriptional regulator [Solirubrobacterales bacterium]|jgi:AcrR family transcriptional regulator|nr:TetR/AcrR family transcriptional regulator [Solirubrobacterales bacterium]